MKLLIIFTMLTLNLTVLAKVIPKAKLDKASKFVQELSQAQGEHVVIKFTEGEMNKNGEITKLTITAKGQDGTENDLQNLTVTAGLKLKKKKLNFVFSISGDIKELAGAFDVNQMVQMIQIFIAQINEEGDYNAKLKISNVKTLTKIKVTLTPVSEDAVSIDSLKINAQLDSKTYDMAVKLDGDFQATAELVSNGQKALTKIFEKLINEEEPSEDDFDDLGEVIAEIMENFNF